VTESDRPVADTGIKFHSTQPQTLILAAGDCNEGEIGITASDKWQEHLLASRMGLASHVSVLRGQLLVRVRAEVAERAVEGERVNARNVEPLSGNALDAISVADVRRESERGRRTEELDTRREVGCP